MCGVIASIIRLCSGVMWRWRLWMTHYYVDEYGFNLKTAAFWQLVLVYLAVYCVRWVAGYQTVIRLIPWLGGCFGCPCWFYSCCHIHRLTLWFKPLLATKLPFRLKLHPIHRVDFLPLALPLRLVKPRCSNTCLMTTNKTWGAVSGVVGLFGGLGGFILPIMFGMAVDITGVRSSAFMIMFGVVWVSLIWIYMSEVRPTMEKGHQNKWRWKKLKVKCWLKYWRNQNPQVILWVFMLNHLLPKDNIALKPSPWHKIFCSKTIMLTR